MSRLFVIPKLTLSLLWLLLLLVACSSDPNSPDPIPSPTLSPAPATSAWGEIITVGQAEQSNAPAILPLDRNRLVIAWTATESNGFSQVIHFWDEAIAPDANRLTLPATYAQGQWLTPVITDRVHLLWLDIDLNAPNDGMRLWTATISPDLQIGLGTIRISDRRTNHYSAVPTGDGGLSIVWSGGLLAEPSLYWQRIDFWGRSQYPTPIITGGDWPILVYVNPTLYLFWLGVPDGQIYRATLSNGAPENVTVIGSSVALNRGDRLATFSAGVDVTHIYLFWNIVRADGEAQTWFTAGAPTATSWNPPAQMGIAVSDIPFETGFNGGAGLRAVAGTTWLSQVAPLTGQADTLAIAAQVEATLGIIYLRAGEITGFQRVVALAEPGLIGMPSFAADRNRHLYLAWSQPTLNGYADLNLTMTR